MYLKKASHLFYAATMMAIGIVGLATGSFAPIFQPVPDAVPARDLLAYLGSFVLLACGAGLLARRTAAVAALTLLVYLMIWTARFKVPFIIRDPLVEVSYQSCGENAVYITAAWVLCGWFSKDLQIGAIGVLGGNAALRIAHLLYGLALIAFGLSHFAYMNLTAPLVPEWLPRPVFWAYFTGAVYLTAGATVATGLYARPGAMAAALQITLITLLVWGPMVLMGDLSPMHWQETIVSWAIMAGAWVMAASFDNRPWFTNAGKVVPRRTEPAIVESAQSHRIEVVRSATRRL